jgi:hypothetical protein
MKKEKKRGCSKKKEKKNRKEIQYGLFGLLAAARVN